jgi:hypothetical protein
MVASKIEPINVFEACNPWLKHGGRKHGHEMELKKKEVENESMRIGTMKMGVEKMIGKAWYL